MRVLPMASLELLGFEDLDDAFKRIGDFPEDVKIDALDAMAQVAAERIKQTGEAMGVRDPESTVHILDKVTRNKAKMSWSGGYEDITFAGTRTRGNTRTRNAEIAFINEYGRRKEEARPFILKAMTQYEEQIAAPGEKIVGDWIEKEFEI